MMPQNKSKHTLLLETIYRTIFSLGGFFYFMATLSTLPSFDQSSSIQFYRFSIRLSSIIMIASQILEWIIRPVPKCSAFITTVSILGSALMLVCISIYPQFNNGLFYIVASFLISVGAEFKILSIILDSKQKFSNILIEKCNRFCQLICIIVASMLFLASSVIQSLQYDKNREISGVINVLSGISILVAIYATVKTERRAGYSKFKMSFELPSIV